MSQYNKLSIPTLSAEEGKSLYGSQRRPFFPLEGPFQPLEGEGFPKSLNRQLRVPCSLLSFSNRKPLLKEVLVCSGGV